MSRSYERLPIEKFGRSLITSGDLDPIYIALHNMRDAMSESQRNRWLLAYWCFYNAGVASFMSEKSGEEYWQWMTLAAANEVGPAGCDCPVDLERWPRGGERRHFRGQQSIKAVAELRARYGDRPEDMVRSVAEPQRGLDPLYSEPLPFHLVNDRAQSHRGFGDWIGFKIADMVDRLRIHPVGFQETEVFFYKDPLKAALMLWRQAQGLPENAQPRDLAGAIHSVVEYLTKEFSDLTAPPTHERPIGLQEVETVLCKWKSSLNGHYEPYKDTKEILLGLQPWSEIETARLFAEAMPKLPEDTSTWQT